MLGVAKMFPQVKWILKTVAMFVLSSRNTACRARYSRIKRLEDSFTENAFLVKEMVGQKSFCETS